MSAVVLLVALAATTHHTPIHRYDKVECNRCPGASNTARGKVTRRAAHPRSGALSVDSRSAHARHAEGLDENAITRTATRATTRPRTSWWCVVDATCASTVVVRLDAFSSLRSPSPNLRASALTAASSTSRFARGDAPPVTCTSASTGRTSHPRSSACAAPPSSRGGPSKPVRPALPHLRQLLCIHKGEGSWDADTGNGYYGGLQMDTAFEEAYGPLYVRRWGHASNWRPFFQMLAAERAIRVRGYSPWPNTARACGLLP